MATRKQRLAEFDGHGFPAAGEAVQLLCEDHSGTYQLPFACRWDGAGWQNMVSGDAIHATVIGWRYAPASSGVSVSRRHNHTAGHATF